MITKSYMITESFYDYLEILCLPNSFMFTKRLYG